MKKLLFACLAAFALQACTSSDSTTAANPILLQSMEQSVLDGSSVTTFAYNGTKIATATTTGGDTQQYTYSGNEITAMDIYNFGGTHTEHFTYTYTGGQLTQMLREQLQTGQKIRQTFAYPDATTITGQYFFTPDAVSPEELLYDQVYTIGGNGEIESLSNTDSSSGSTTYSYAYDAKNNPFMNVTGYQQLMMMQGFQHNVTGIGWSTDGAPAQQQTTTYEYNSDDFPASASTVVSGMPSTVTYHYQ